MCVSYCCKTQTTTTTSSTEAEFYTSDTAAKQAKYLCAVLIKQGFRQAEPARIHRDNQSAIKMTNAQIPTERSRHICIQWFALQDCKMQGHIVLDHIMGIINPSDNIAKSLGWILHSHHTQQLIGHFDRTQY